MSAPSHLTLVLLLASGLAHAQVQAGDLLVARAGPDRVEHYRADGTLVMTTSGAAGSELASATLTQSGLICATRRNPNGFELFDPLTGLAVSAHDTPQLAGPAGDVDVFADGMLAIAGAATVELYTETGVHAGTLAAAGEVAGLHVDLDDTLWLCDAGSGGRLRHLDRAGNSLADLPLAFTPGDVVSGPDGSLWVSDREAGIVVHLDRAGVELGSFFTAVPTPDFNGLGLGPDGTLYAASASATALEHYDAVGNSLGGLRLAGVGSTGFLAVVGGARASIAVYCTAGTSANGCLASLSAVGVPSVGSPSGFVVSASSAEVSANGLFFYGTSGRAAAAWGNSSSFRCVAPPLTRTPALASSGRDGRCGGTFTRDLNSLWFTQPSLAPSAGATVNAQFWYRDPWNTSNRTTSLSDALEFVALP